MKLSLVMYFIDDSDERTGNFHWEAREIFEILIWSHRRFAWNFVLRLLGFNTFYSTPASCTGFNNVNSKDNDFAHKFGRLTKGQEVADLSLRQIARLCSYRADLLLVELQKRMQGFVFSSASKSPIFYMLTRVFMQDSASMPTFARVASIVRIFKFESIHWMLTVNTLATAHQNS